MPLLRKAINCRMELVNLDVCCGYCWCIILPISAINNPEETAPMQDDPPEDDDDLSEMLDDARTTPPNPYGEE